MPKMADDAAARARAEHASKEKKTKTGNGHAGETSQLPIVHLFPLDETTIPVRDWEVPGLLMRRQVTVLVAPSGSGKSLLTLQLSLACAQGTPWAGWRPRGRYKVLIVNSEDDQDEMSRRLAAALHVMPEIKQEELRDRVVIVDQSYDAIIAKFDARSKTLVRTPVVEMLIATILQNKFDMIVVDPFAETFEGDENSNSELKWAGIIWREVARRTKIAVLLVHHTKKYATGMAGDVDAARGAGALIGIARIVSTLFPMTAKEAAELLVDETDKNRVAYLRYDDAKANLNMISNIAKWFHKRTIKLNNAADPILADDVGVLMPWKPKGPLDGFSDIKISEFFSQLDRGIPDKDGNPSGEFWTLDSRKNKESEISRYVGDFIEKFFEVHHDRAITMLTAWRHAKAFVEDKYHSKRLRKEVTRVRSRNAQKEGQNGVQGDMEPDPEPGLF